MARDPSKYVVEGARVPSVTEILQLNGLVDFSAVPEDVLETARVRGTEVHEWCELIDLGEEATPTDEIVAGRVEAYRRFLFTECFEVETIEQPVVNTTHRYAGTPDRTGKINGRYAVVDLKPPGAVLPWYALQLAGYAACLKEAKRFTLQLRNDATYVLTPHTNRNDFHDFLAANRLAHWRLNHGMGELS